MQRPILKGLVVAAVTGSVVVLGCGRPDREAYHAQLAKYTPENLASEMANRFLAGQAARAQGKAAPDAAAAEVDAAKGETTTKEAQAKGAGPGDVRIPTPESIAGDIARKAGTVEGMTPQQVFDGIVAALKADDRLDDEQATLLADELRRAMEL